MGTRTTTCTGVWILLGASLVMSGACTMGADSEEAPDDLELGASAVSVTASLDKEQYAVGDIMTLSIAETIMGARTTKITDSGAQAWTKKSDNGKTMVWTAKATGASGQFTVKATVTPSGGAAVTASDTYTRGAVPTSSRWPGHQVGKIYLGMSAAANEWDAKVAELSPQSIGVRRRFFEWNDATSEAKAIASDHAAGRMPWVSFKPPGAGTTGQRWDSITSGAFDADIRARAKRYAALAQPVIVTFHHEPSNDAGDAEGVKWANAWTHIYDVMNDETGLANTTFAPILGDWLFSPKNAQEPEAWLKSSVIERKPFLGIDLYQNGNGEGFAVRLGRILDWLADHGDPDAMVGIGECGASDFFGSPGAVAWWNASWAWATANTDRIGVVSYFNSTQNSKHEWPLNESSGKLAAFKASLGSPTTTLLP